VGPAECVEGLGAHRSSGDMAPGAAFLDAWKNWELDWASVGAVIFIFVPKTRFLDRVLGIF
jgi:hypothetical protein